MRFPVPAQLDLRFCFWIDDLKDVALQGPQLRLSLDHLGLR